MSTNATPVSFTQDRSTRARVALRAYAFALGIVPAELDQVRAEIFLMIPPGVPEDTRVVLEDAAVLIALLVRRGLENPEKRVWQVVREATGLEA